MKDNFVVRPISAGGWDYIAAALARLFGGLRATRQGHCVVVDVSDEHYVQFIVRPDGTLWAESIGDEFLEANVLDDEQHRALELMGWTPPDPGGKGGGNYWHEYDEPGHDLEATVVAVLTCVDVFRVGPRAEVRVAVFEAVGSR
ncbi:MAG: hypothetical protein M3Q30_00970 [Actinomycetota bacterium]|nr:hypothetical protein [Actinomycetota bacterium]